jgi:hypothetical protein
MTSRTLPNASRGNPRPIRPEWQITPAEIAAMIARPYFLRFIVERRQRRKLKPALRRSSH